MGERWLGQDDLNSSGHDGLGRQQGRVELVNNIIKLTHTDKKFSSVQLQVPRRGRPRCSLALSRR